MDIPTELETILEEIKDVDYRALERTEELGSSYSLKEAAIKLEEIAADLREVVENMDLLKIPDETLNHIQGIAQRLRDKINKMRSFVVKDNPQATPEYDGINEQARGLYQEDLKHLQPLLERISLRKLRSSDIEEEISKAKSALEEAKEIKDSLKALVTDAESSVKDVRSAFGSHGASSSSTHFQTQATEHQDASNRWFRALVAAVILATLLIVALFSGWIAALRIDDGIQYPKLIQIALFKLVLLSIAYLFIQQSLKNYKVNRHLYVLNKHRQLALEVYPFMANATSDLEQANTIVGQAAKVIFEPGATGYLSGDDNPNPINLTEIINKVVDRKVP